MAVVAPSVANPRVAFTIFRDLHDTLGAQYALPWSDLVTYLAQPRIWHQKNGELFGPLFSGRKSKTDFAGMSVGVVDIDGVEHSGESVERVQGFLAKLAQLQVAYVVASSYSHAFLAPHLCKVHVFFPLSRELTEGREWHHVFDWMQRYSDGLLDPKLRNEHMAVFLPCMPATGNMERRIFWTQEGLPLDVDQILAQDLPVLETQVSNVIVGKFGTTDVVAEKDLRDLAKVLKKGKSPEDQAHGRLLNRALDGQKIARKGERHDTLIALAWRIAKKFPYADPLEIAHHFVVSLTQMAADGDEHGKLNQDGFAEKIRTAQQKHLAELTSKRSGWQEDDQASREARIADCYARIGEKRKTPYSHDEMKAYAQARGLTVQQAHRRWIINHGTAYYFYVMGQYTPPMAKESASISAKLLLEPTGLALTTTSSTGTPRDLRLAELVDRYGVVANSVVADLTISKSYFDEEKQEMHEAVAPLDAKLVPKWEPAVDAWLRAMSGNKYEKLCDWLATSLVIAKPTCALFLYGAKKTGKTLLAHGVARLWGSEPTELEDVHGNFNDKLAKNPIVFGDEYVPQDRQGDPDTQFLRNFLQGHTRSYKRKFMPTSSLVGAARVIVAANSVDVLVGAHKTLTDNDIQAINERFLCINVREEAVAQLENCPLTLEQVAQHVYALYSYRQVMPGSRFLVEGEPGSELEIQLRTGAGLRSELCRWVCGFLSQPGRCDGLPEKPVVTFMKGFPTLLVTSKIVHLSWAQYCDQNMRPRMGSLSKALGHLSRRTSVRIKGRTKSMREIDLDMVAHWAENVGELSSDEIADTMMFLATHRRNE